MCLNCGCHKAHDDHENAANITYEDVKAAAEANKQLPQSNIRPRGLDVSRSFDQPQR